MTKAINWYPDDLLELSSNLDDLWLLKRKSLEGEKTDSYAVNLSNWQSNYFYCTRFQAKAHKALLKACWASFVYLITPDAPPTEEKESDRPFLPQAQSALKADSSFEMNNREVGFAGHTRR